MSTTPLFPPDPDVAHARVGRSIASSALVLGSTDPDTLASYQKYLTISVLLGDLDIDIAAHSLDRAKQVFEANLYKLHRLAADSMKDPHENPRLP